MPEVTTSPADVHHVRGRTYKVTVDKRHRPAQIPRDTVPIAYYGEVTLENAGRYDLLFVESRMRERLEALAAQGHPDGSNCTFNELLQRVVPYLEQTAALGPDPEPSSWMPERLEDR